MGSTVRINDTLQITPQQGFPNALNIEQHLRQPILASAFETTVFEFFDKDGIRSFQQPPTVNFLVENRAGRHIYWGLIRVESIAHDYLNNTTSGRYRLQSIYTPEQMKMAAAMTGLASDLDYFLSTNP